MEEKPLPLVKVTSRPPHSDALTLKRDVGGMAASEPLPLKKKVRESEEGVEILGPGIFRLPVSEDATTKRAQRPKHKDAIIPPSPGPDSESIDTFRLVISEKPVEEDAVTLRKDVRSPPAPGFDDAVTEELKSPAELRRSTRPPKRGEVAEGESLQETEKDGILPIQRDDSLGRSLREIRRIQEEREDEEDGYEIVGEEELLQPSELRRSTRPPMTGEVPEDQPLFTLAKEGTDIPDGDSSLGRSLNEIKRLGEERKEAEEQQIKDREEAEEPEQAPEQETTSKPPMTGAVPEDQPLFVLDEGEGLESVDSCIRMLQDLEDDRQLQELEKAEREELEAKRTELLSVLSSRAKKVEKEERKAKEEASRRAAAEAEAKEEQARREEEAARKAEEERLSLEEARREEDIQVDVEIGFPWEEGHLAHKLDRDEVAKLQEALPERQRRYILPVPEDDTREAHVAKAALRKETRVNISGKAYYIMESEFAGSKIAARVGDNLHVWPSDMGDYEFLVKIGVDTPEYDEVSWKSEYILSIRDEEMEIVEGLIPEKRPLLLHPVPVQYTKNPYNRSIIERCAETPIVDIDGDEYYVIEAESMAVWREAVINLKNVRMVSREGKRVNIWGGDINGHSLFSCERTCHIASYGTPGAPLIPKGHNGFVEPYNAEEIDVSTAYEDGNAKRYLYPMPENISKMDSDGLLSLMIIAKEYIEKKKHSPLISLRGRWYMALEYPYKDSRESSYENGRVKIHKGDTSEEILGRLREKNRQRKEAAEEPVVKLPRDPEHRVRLIALLPEGQSRYLLVVSQDFKSSAPDVWVRNGEGFTRYLVFEKPVEGAFEVRRTRDDIMKV